MSYISQSIVFVLAILAVFFKSIQTDEHGRNLHSRFGLLMLTKPGKVIVTLLIVSFIVSLLTTRDNQKTAKAKEDTLTKSLSTVTDQNSRLLKTADDQAKQNLIEFGKQTDHLAEVTGKVDSSSRELLSNLRDTSSVLGNRLDTSIGLLQYSEKEIERAGNPIRDVYISFSAQVPMNSAVLAKYRNDMSRKLDSLIKDVDRMDADHVKYIGPPVDDNFLGVSIARGSSLLPDIKAEPYAYSILNSIQLHVEFYKTDMSLEEVRHKRLKPDLRLSVAPFISPGGRMSDFAEAGMQLQYFFGDTSIFLNSKDVPVKIDAMQRTSKITSIPDLRNAKVVAYFGWGVFLDNTDWKSFSDDFEQISLSTLSFRMSGGLILTCDHILPYEKSTLPSFVCKLPKV